MNWFKIKDELPPDDFRVLLCDINGFITFGTYDGEDFGFSDDNCDELINIIAWSYPPKVNLGGIITHDDFIKYI